MPLEALPSAATALIHSRGLPILKSRPSIARLGEMGESMVMIRTVGLFVLAAASYSTQGQAASITYDCDTASGHYSQLVLPAPAGAFTVSGSVQINQTYPNKTWIPIGRIKVGPPPPSPGAPQPAFGGIAFSALPGKAVSRPEKFIQFLSFVTAGKKEEILRHSLQAMGPAQRFTARATATEVTFTIGSESRTFPLPAGPKSVEIVCSTGEFLFTDLVVAPIP